MVSAFVTKLFLNSVNFILNELGYLKKNTACLTLETTQPLRFDKSDFL